MNELNDKYKSNHKFKEIVDYLVAYIYKNNITPSEMSDASVYASILTEKRENGVREAIRIINTKPKELFDEDSLTYYRRIRKRLNKQLKGDKKTVEYKRLAEENEVAGKTSSVSRHNTTSDLGPPLRIEIESPPPNVTEDFEFYSSADILLNDIARDIRKNIEKAKKDIISKKDETPNEGM